MGGANFWWQKVKTSGVEKSMCFQHVKELKDVFLHEMIISMRNMTTKAPDVGLCHESSKRKPFPAGRWPSLGFAESWFRSLGAGSSNSGSIDPGSHRGWKISFL